MFSDVWNYFIQKNIIKKVCFQIFLKNQKILRTYCSWDFLSNSTAVLKSSPFTNLFFLICPHFSHF